MALKEENLIPVEGIIKSGQRLVKIGETFVPIGFGGNFEPGVISYKEEGRDTYYKCASVGETTWDGYALILGADGYYTISETLTTGLTYGIGYTPKVDGVYNANATIDVSKYNKLVVIPEEDLIFYAPLSAEASTAETGQALTTNGTVTYETVDGIPCAYFGTKSSNLKSLVTLENNQKITVSFWVYMDDNTNLSGESYPRVFCIGASSTTNNATDWICLTHGKSQDTLAWQTPDYGRWPTVNWNVLRNKWVHFVGVYDADTLYAYFSNEYYPADKQPQLPATLPLESSVLINTDRSVGVSGIRLAGCRIYNRVLTDDEILALSQEFTPTA